MEGRFKYLIKNTSILTVSNFSSKLLVFLLVPLYTNVLTTAEYGLYDIIMSTIQLSIPFLTMNIVDGVLRFLMDKNVKQADVKSIGLKYILLASGGAFILLFINHALNLWSVLKNYELYIFIYFVSYVLNQLFIQTAKGQKQVKELGIAGVISTVVSLMANILFLLIIPMGLKGFFIAYILGQGVSVIYLCITTSFFHGTVFPVKKELQRSMLAYSLPLILGTLGWLINNVSDRYIVTWMCGISENGIYSVSYKIPTIIITVQNIFIQAWTISAIQEYESPSRNTFYKKTFVYLNFIMVACCTGLLFGTKFIAKLLYAKDFYSAWQYVPFLLISVVFGASSGYIGPILSAEKNSKALAKSTAYGAIINLVLNVVLIHFIGAQGAAISTAVSNLVIYVVRRKAIGNILFGHQYKNILVSWFLLVIQAFLMIIDISVLMQIPVILILCFIYRETFLEVWKRVYLKISHRKND